MSVSVNGRPISLWTDRAIMEELNVIVSTEGIDPTLVVIAEAAYRALILADALQQLAAAHRGAV